MRPGLYAFAAAAVFLGATIYIGFVEHPARMKLSGPAMIQEWKLSNRRGTLTLSVFAAVSAILAYIQFRANGDVRWHHDPGELAIRLLRDDAGERLALRIPPAKAVSPVRELMRDWGLLEWGHALIGFAACCPFAW